MQRTLRDKVAVWILFGAVFTVRSLVLRADILTDEGVRLEVPHAVHLTSVLFSQTLANGLGDVVACAVLAVIVACLEPPRLVAVAAVLMVAAAAGLLVSRRSVGVAVERAWKVQQRVYEAFVDVLEGRRVAAARSWASWASGPALGAWPGCGSPAPRCSPVA